MNPFKVPITTWLLPTIFSHTNINIHSQECLTLKQTLYKLIKITYNKPMTKPATNEKKLSKVLSTNNLQNLKIHSVLRLKTNCDHCGHKIENVFIVENTQTNQQFNIGSECVKKIDQTLTHEVNHKLKIFKKSLAREKKQTEYNLREALKKEVFQNQLELSTSLKDDTSPYLVQISETSMLEEFQKFLLNSDCQPTNNPILFDAQTPDNQTYLSENFEGIIKVDLTSIIQLKKQVTYLEQYTGRFNFLNSLKDQLSTKGYLTDGQLTALQKIIEKEKNRVQRPVLDFTDKNVQIRVSQFMARILGDKVGLDTPHYMFRVFKVSQQSDKAFLMTLQATGTPTTHCSCCGLRLTNKKSIKIGIGPICAQKWGVTNYIELNEKLTQTKIFESWVPKQSIREIIGADDLYIPVSLHDPVNQDDEPESDEVPF